MEKAGLATRCLRLGWRLVDGQFFTHDVHLSLPSRDMTLFSRLLSDVNNKIDPGFGIEMSWIETLDCIPLAPFETELVHLNSQGRVKIARDAYVNLIDRLVARLGRGAIMRLVPKEFWQPEAAQSFEFPDPDQLFLESDKRVKWLCSLNRKTTPPRPIRLLAHPQPVDVIVLSEEYRPIRFICRGVLTRLFTLLALSELHRRGGKHQKVLVLGIIFGYEMISGLDSGYIVKA